jgi:hypothetical protein
MYDRNVPIGEKEELDYPLRNPQMDQSMYKVEYRTGSQKGDGDPGDGVGFNGYGQSEDNPLPVDVQPSQLSHDFTLGGKGKEEPQKKDKTIDDTHAYKHLSDVKPSDDKGAQCQSKGKNQSGHPV